MEEGWGVGGREGTGEGGEGNLREFGKVLAGGRGEEGRHGREAWPGSCPQLSWSFKAFCQTAD